MLESIGVHSKHGSKREPDEWRFGCVNVSRFRSFSKLVPAALLFALSLLLRIWNLDADVLDDEGYYYYLTLFPEKYLNLHRNHPPMLYLIYHPFAYNLTILRLINGLVGSLIPVLVYFLLDAHKVQKELRIIGGVVAATNIILVKYSGIVFLDTLSVAFLLLSLIFYGKRHWGLVGLTTALAILTKEYSALAVMPIVLCSWLRYRSLKITIKCGSGLILGLGVVYYVLFPMKGVLDLVGGVAHADPLTSIWNVLLFFAVIPAVVVLFKGLYEEGLIVISFASFMFLWSTNLDWYLVLPIPLIIVVVIRTFELISARLSSLKKDSRFFLSTRGVARRSLGLILMLYLIILASPFDTYAYLQNWHPHGLQHVVGFLREQYPDGAITLVDCFWAYEFYPFGVEYVPLHKDYTSAAGEFNLTYYESHILETGLAVFCYTQRPQGGLRDQLLATFHDNIVYSKDNFIVVALPNRKTTVEYYDPRVSLEVVDGAGHMISRVGIGEKIFFRGRLVDSRTGTPLVGQWIHLYAFVGVLAPASEWDSERTDQRGFYDTSWAGYPQSDNEAEWIEVRQDGLYKNGDVRIWIGNPVGQTILAYAEMWGLGGETSASQEVLVERSGTLLFPFEWQYAGPAVVAIALGLVILFTAKRLRKIMLLTGFNMIL